MVSFYCVTTCIDRHGMILWFHDTHACCNSTGIAERLCYQRGSACDASAVLTMHRLCVQREWQPVDAQERALAEPQLHRQILVHIVCRGDGMSDGDMRCVFMLRVSCNPHTL